MLSENLNIDSIGVDHELKPGNARCTGPCYLVHTAMLKYFLKTVFLHLFSFSASTTREMFDEFVNTYTNNFWKKENNIY